MLVRRRVLEDLGGFDDELPIFGNDIDFGWRAAQAGHRTMVIPQAVVFHAEAAHRGVRRTPLTGRHTHFQERRAALFTMLANAPGRALPWQVVRLFFGSLLRVLGYLVVRSVGEALDELAAVLSVYARPGQLRSARRARADRGARPRTRAPCWRRCGCPTATGSTSSSTWWPPRPTRPPTSPSVDERPSSPSRPRPPAPSAGGVSTRRTSSSRTAASWRGSSPTRSRWRSRSSPCSRSSPPAPPSAPSPAAPSPRCRATRPTGGGCTSRRGTRSAPAPTCPRPPTSCPSRCWRRSSVAAPVR